MSKQTGTTTAEYIYDMQGAEVAQTDGNKNLVREEVYAGGRHLATYTGSATYYNYADWLGTERARTDSSGARCETITGLPFGDGESTSGSCTPTPIYFTGKERDPGSGLDNFGAR